MDLIQGVVVRPLKQIHDERGYLMEMLRTDWPEFERPDDDALNQRSEEHTSELQSRPHLLSRLLLGKKQLKVASMRAAGSMESARTALNTGPTPFYINA